MKQSKLSKIAGLSTFFAILALVLAACAPAAPTAAPTAVIPVTGTTSTPMMQASATAMMQATATAMPPAAASATLVNMVNDPKLGAFLVDAKGMTLYVYEKDAAGVSNCSGQCLVNWPALVASGTLTAGSGVTGALGSFTRSDGTMQVTYNNMPLYYFIGDKQPGDTVGQGKGGVWFVAPVSGTPPMMPSATPAGGTSQQMPATPAAMAATVMLGNDPKLGSFLVDSKGMTLYLYTKDTPGVSNCSGACLKAWPPLGLPATGSLVAGPGVTGTLGTLTRSDGTLQVTYNGMPLYYWAKDMKPGDVTGQGVGGVWYVVPPTK